MSAAWRTVPPLLLLAIATAGAQQAGEEAARAPVDAGEADRSEARTRLLDNKLRLLEALLHRGDAAARIELGTHAEAKSLLAGARTALEAARSACGAQLPAAPCEMQLNRGLKAFTAAAQLAGDPERQERLAGERYHELTRRIGGFREAFVRITAENPADARLLDLDRVDRLADRAAASARQRDFEAANTLAAQAAELLEQALAQARHRRTLVHALRFDSPAEEYTYESERNRGHEVLIRLLMTERTLPEGERRSILMMLEDNARARAEAEALAARGEAPAAIRRFEQATESLVRALRRLGAPIP